MIEPLEQSAPGEPRRRLVAAERIEAFNDRRVGRYWALVAIVNGWPPGQQQSPEQLHDAWDWYAQALRAHG